MKFLGKIDDSTSPERIAELLKSMKKPESYYYTAEDLVGMPTMGFLGGVDD
jgi:hypothetical protein